MVAAVCSIPPRFFVDDNRRGHPRKPIATAAYISSNRILIARAGDLSATGAFLATRHPDPVGTRCTVEIALDDDGGARETVTAEVVRVSFDGGRDGTRCGMGVCFVDVPIALRRRLLQLFPQN